MAPISGSRAVQLTCRSTHRSSADLGIGRMFRYRPEIFGASFAIFLTISIKISTVVSRAAIDPQKGSALRHMISYHAPLRVMKTTSHYRSSHAVRVVEYTRMSVSTPAPPQNEQHTPASFFLIERFIDFESYWFRRIERDRELRASPALSRYGSTA